MKEFVPKNKIELVRHLRQVIFDKTSTGCECIPTKNFIGINPDSESGSIWNVGESGNMSCRYETCPVGILRRELKEYECV